MCEQIIEAMASGLSKEASAAKVGISEDCFYRWIRENAEFKGAVKEGTRRNLLFWEDLGRRGVAGEIQGFNAVTWIFNMKNRFRENWRDKYENEHYGKGGGAIQSEVNVKGLSDAALQQLESIVGSVVDEAGVD